MKEESDQWLERGSKSQELRKGMERKDGKLEGQETHVGFTLRGVLLDPMPVAFLVGLFLLREGRLWVFFEVGGSFGTCDGRRISSDRRVCVLSAGLELDSRLRWRRLSLELCYGG